MKTTTITIKDYPISEYFCVAAVWNNGHNWAVYENVKQAQMSMIARFGNCKFIDARTRRETTEDGED